MEITNNTRISELCNEILNGNEDVLEKLKAVQELAQERRNVSAMDSMIYIMLRCVFREDMKNVNNSVRNFCSFVKGTKEDGTPIGEGSFKQAVWREFKEEAIDAYPGDDLRGAKANMLSRSSMDFTFSVSADCTIDEFIESQIGIQINPSEYGENSVNFTARLADYEKYNRLQGMLTGEIHIRQQQDINNSGIVELIRKEVELGGRKQIVFTGAPGTGKTYGVRSYIKSVIPEEELEDRYIFVQFHSSYDYSDFVEGLRPIENNGNMIFVRMDGLFKSFCRKVIEKFGDDSDKKCFFVIDEINRADLSRVFGELMFSLEEGYRGKGNTVRTQYHNLPCYDGEGQIIENDCFEKGFYIPRNVYILATMNDIDRSVESFDFALRRRFLWANIKANEVMRESLKGILRDISDEAVEELCERVIRMNNKMTEMNLGLSCDYHVGPAYFKSYDGTEESLEKIYKTAIEPLLREYTRGRKSSLTENLLASCKEALGL